MVKDKAVCAKISEIKDFFEEGEYLNQEPGPRNIIKVKPMVSDQ